MNQTDIATTTEKVDVLVVGAGFSGLGAVIKLDEAGFRDVFVLERASDVGGTWRDNTYPGAACDVPSHLYSYSFALNPSWSRAFSPQGEIHEYIRGVADSAGVRDRIRFGVEVTDAAYDADRGRWTVQTTAGPFDARVLILGVGALCEPRLPDIEGIDSFAGDVFHSARWDHSVPLSTRRIAVIGTGASAIQIVPAIAERAGHVDVYQRTAPWILPRLDRRYPEFERQAYRRIPGLQRAVRGLQYLTREAQVVGLAKNRMGLAPLKAVAKAFLRMQVRDPELRRKVTPDYELGCKRMLLSNAWYPALQRPNVDLVTEPIARVTPTGIVTTDQVEHPADVLVVATGFHVTDSPFFELVRGTEGRSLAQVWQDQGMSAYKGTTVSGFPNCFVLVGPATGLGHSSMIYMIESQLAYVVDAMRRMRREGVQTVDVRREAQDAYNAELREVLGDTVWISGGCSSWYMDDKGNAPAVWPHFTFTFREQMKNFDLDAYHRVPVAAPVSG